MRLLRSLDQLDRARPRTVTVGAFDGLHRGHLVLLRTLVRVAAAAGAVPTVVAFDPHPDAVLRGAPPALLCDLEERLERLATAGIGETVLEPFDRALAATPAAGFLERLGAGAGLVAVVMTPESAFGRGREGTPETVARIGRELGFRVVPVAPLRSGGASISSGRIRMAIAAGKLAEARRWLGRPAAVTGLVVAGANRGRSLGFPTANLAFDAPVCLPPDGIYAVGATWRDASGAPRAAGGVASLGVRPTFGPGERTLEVHLFEIDEPLYGTRLRVEFLRRQRGERRFGDPAALVRQMERDAARARVIVAAAR